MKARARAAAVGDPAAAVAGRAAGGVDPVAAAGPETGPVVAVVAGPVVVAAGPVVAGAGVATRGVAGAVETAEVADGVAEETPPLPAEGG